MGAAIRQKARRFDVRRFSTGRHARCGHILLEAVKRRFDSGLRQEDLALAPEF